jgi:hypothetical protein
MPARGDTQPRGNAVPGTLNYVEGQVSVDSQPLDSKSVGSSVLATGQSITTENGKAELLLTPGVFLRVGGNSSVKMISPSLTNTEIGIDKGEASVEVTEIHKQNDIRVDADGVTTELVKNGYYDFDTARNQVLVLDGEAIVDDSGRQVKVKGGHELTLNQESTKPQSFDKKNYESSDLYNWSSLRSAYLAEANVDAAPGYIYGGGFGPGWYGAGWYWDPWFSAYTFIPGDGIFYSPFGWGFYSPFWAFDAPFFFDGHFHHHFDRDFRGRDAGPHYAAGVRGGGFHAGHGYVAQGGHAANGFRGGGAVHGGGGAVHSGGFSGGGGFHGGGGGFGGGGHGH